MDQWINIKIIWIINIIHGSISYHYLHYFKIYIFFLFASLNHLNHQSINKTHVNRTFDDVEHNGQQVLELMLLGGPILKGLDDGGESGVGLETGVYKVPYNPFFYFHTFSVPPSPLIFFPTALLSYSRNYCFPFSFFPRYFIPQSLDIPSLSSQLNIFPQGGRTLYTLYLKDHRDVPVLCVLGALEV